MRASLLLLATILLACRSEPPADPPVAPPPPSAVAAKAPIPAPAPAPEAPLPDDECGRMLTLLRQCDSSNRTLRERRFAENFLAACADEIKRPTLFARRFAACAASTECEVLRRCSGEMERSVVEVGAEHVDYLLTHGQRDAALKFCEDHRRVISRSLPLDRRCHPLLRELDRQRSEQHQHGPQCNH